MNNSNGCKEFSLRPSWQVLLKLKLCGKPGSEKLDFRLVVQSPSKFCIWIIITAQWSCSIPATENLTLITTVLLLKHWCWRPKINIFALEPDFAVTFHSFDGLLLLLSPHLTNTGVRFHTSVVVTSRLGGKYPGMSSVSYTICCLSDALLSPARFFTFLKIHHVIGRMSQTHITRTRAHTCPFLFEDTQKLFISPSLELSNCVCRWQADSAALAGIKQRKTSGLNGSGWHTQTHRRTYLPPSVHTDP